MLRLFTAIAVIAVSGVMHVEQWPVHVLLMAVMWSAALTYGASLTAMLRRLVLFLPFVLAIGLGVPATQDGRWDWPWSLTILCRSLVAFFAGLWLVQALPFAELIVVLRNARLPDVLVASLTFMHRYLVVLWEELERLKTARNARCGELSRLQKWSTSAQMIGALLIRAWDRAERVHRAMLARGAAAGTAGTSI